MVYPMVFFGGCGLSEALQRREYGLPTEGDGLVCAITRAHAQTITHMAMQGRGRGLGCVHPVAKSPIKMVEGATQRCYTGARDRQVQVSDFSQVWLKNAPSPRERHLGQMSLFYKASSSSCPISEFGGTIIELL